ncbi:MAG: glycosyltransferase family 39 protein [Lentisphaerae bacterium]|nr:glycosyltransferase family 39 protein [Lentisphaerota bacterium]
MTRFRRLIDTVLLASVPCTVVVSVLGRPVLGALILFFAVLVLCVRGLFMRGAGWKGPAVAAPLLVVVAILALLPRLTRLSDSSLNSDELLWMRRGSTLVGMLEAGRAVESTDGLHHPGLVSAYLVGCSRHALREGSPSRFAGILDNVSASRLPLALLGACTCIFLFLAGRLIWGDWTAFLAAVLLAVDPVHIGLSRVAHVDGTLALFFMMTVLAYCIGEMRGSWRWKLASGVFFGFGLLTKLPAIVLPAILLVWKLFVLLERGIYRRMRAGDEKGAPPAAASPLVAPIDVLCMLIGYLTYVALFPRLWGSPESLAWSAGSTDVILYRSVHAVCDLLRRVPLAEVSLGVYVLGLLWWRRGRAGGTGYFPRRAVWGFAALAVAVLLLFRLIPNAIENTSILVSRLAGMGTGMRDPDHTPIRGGYETSLAFYPLVLLVRTPELLLLCCMVGGVIGLVRMVKDPEWTRRIGVVFVATIGFVLTTSFSRKMAMRYILPIQPFLCVLGALGVAWICGLVETRFSTRMKSVRPLLARFAAVGVVLCAYLPAHVFYAPNYYLYHNVFIGGARGAAEHFMVGWGEGYREVTRALKSIIKDPGKNVSVLGSYSLVRYYWSHGKPAPAVPANIGTSVFEEADYLVTVLNQLQRRRKGSIYKYAMDHRPIHVVNLQGVDIAWIYRHEREPVTKKRSYKASSRQMGFETGRRIYDESLRKTVVSADRREDSPGWLLRGPRRTYEPGSYVATFSVRVEPGPGTGEVGVLDVAVSDGGARFAERALTRSEFEPPDDYTDFAVPFELDRTVSLEFRVYWKGNADMRVYSVKVKRDTSGE